MLKSLIKALSIGALLMMTTSGYAKETVVWWDFLGGGDGVRMKKLITDFNAEHADTIEIQATTLDWGVPFYTKVQTSAAVGEGPDVMTYHTSRIPLAVSQNTLQEITAADWEALGLGPDSFAPAIWEAVQADGKQYAVPLDTHPIVLYYNKDKLAAAGLIGEDGLPKDLNGIDNFNAALAKLQEGGTQWSMSTFTASGDFQFRTIYSLLCQQDGEMLTGDEWLAGDNKEKLANALTVVSNWVTDGHVPAYTEYPAAIALFTSGESAMHINGVWEVPTFTDLAAQDKLGFEWGAIELPVFFDHACTYSDSHAFAIPNNEGREMTPEKRTAVLEVISWMLDKGLFWASAGHIPALKSVTDSADYQGMQPNATYAVLTANMVYDPKSVFSGVASPMFASAGNAFTAAVNGEEDPVVAVDSMKEELDALE
jgi:multiple sugar transport system substrate-binding protein